MYRIIVMKINPDLINRCPALVTIGFFDRTGALQQTMILAGRLFPKDIQENDEVLFYRADETLPTQLASKAEM